MVTILAIGDFHDRPFVNPAPINDPKSQTEDQNSSKNGYGPIHCLRGDMDARRPEGKEYTDDGEDQGEHSDRNAGATQPEGTPN